MPDDDKVQEAETVTKVGVYMLIEEKDVLEAFCKAHGYTMSSFLRIAGFKEMTTMRGVR